MSFRTVQDGLAMGAKQRRATYHPRMRRSWEPVRIGRPRRSSTTTGGGGTIAFVTSIDPFTVRKAVANDVGEPSYFVFDPATSDVAAVPLHGYQPDDFTENYLADQGQSEERSWPVLLIEQDGFNVAVPLHRILPEPAPLVEDECSECP